MVIVFQVHRRTTSLAPFEHGVLHKLQIQVSLPLLKLNKSILLYNEKGQLIHHRLMMRDAAGHDILWSAFTLFFLLYGQLFCAIEQSRIRLNGGSYLIAGVVLVARN